MLKMKNILVFPAAMLLSLSMLTAQVQVSKEPRHKKVLENKYIRLLDVWLQPGDTSLFHIHSTPSVFLIFTSATTVSQVKGGQWEKSESVSGTSWYRSFFQDTLIHRVGNCGTTPFHVNDVEILSSWNKKDSLAPLPFFILYNTEKAIAYKLMDFSFNGQIISDRGPMIAELVEGDEIIFHDTKNKKSTSIKNGKYLYIEPGSSFYFSAKENEKINLVLFEIK